VSDALHRLLLIALLGVTFICCLPSLDAPFTHDEEAGIAVNRAVHPGATLRQAATYRYSPDQTRPLFFVTLLLEGRLHGLAPRGYRVLSLLMHIACGLVVYVLLRRLRPISDGAALAGSAFFLLHPMQSESIIYIWGRSGVQSALLALLALMTVPWPAAGHGSGARREDPARRATGPQQAWRWIAALALMALALAAKEEAVALPLMAFVYWVLAENRSARPALARAAALAAPVVAFVALRPLLLGAVGRQVFARGLGDNILGQAVVTLRLLRLTILPIGQSFDPAASVPTIAVGALAAFSCIAVIGLALVGGMRLRAAAVDSPAGHSVSDSAGEANAAALRWICAGILMSAAAYVLYWIVPLPDLMSERRVYLAYVGGALVVHGVSAFLSGLVRRGAPAGDGAPAMAWLPMLVVTLLLAPALHARSRVWSDPRLVWEEALRLAPQRVRPYIDLGVMAAVRGDSRTAGVDFDRALALEPHNPEALYNRGKLRLDAGDVAGAATDLDAAVAADPTMVRARINLAIARIRQGNLDDAEAQLRAALAIDPGDPRALTNLGEVRRARGDTDQAIALYRQALASDASYSHAAARLGVALEARGDTAGALTAYREYLARGPESATDRAAVEEKIRLLSSAAP
jgi:Flp pilus assembly protein TadD